MPKNIITVDNQTFRVDDVTGKIEIVKFEKPTREQEAKVIAELAKRASPNLKSIIEE
jgi:hypothetical protein